MKEENTKGGRQGQESGSMPSWTQTGESHPQDQTAKKLADSPSHPSLSLNK